MLRRYLSHLLIALIALQSVVSFADVHQIHQSGTEHLAHEYEQSILPTDPVVLDALSDTTDTSQLDCQHCCHCHGTVQVILTMDQVKSFNTQLNRITSLYRCAYLSLSISPDNPPPIS